MRITNEQRRRLCELMYFVLTEIRMLSWKRNAKQAADLADAFHNLPKDMWKDDFALERFRDSFLKGYQAKYRRSKMRNYVARIDEIIAMEADPSAN